MATAAAAATGEATGAAHILYPEQLLLEQRKHDEGRDGDGAGSTEHGTGH